MVIEITPTETSRFTATFFHESIAIAEIKDAPHEIASQWAEAMRDLHGGHPEIRRTNMCQYCGSTEQRGLLCSDCDRVFAPRY